MNETPHDLEQQVENLILAHFSERGGDEPEADQEEGTAEPSIIDIDLYRLEGGAVLLVPGNGTSPLDANAVESEAPMQEDQGAPPAGTATTAQGEAEPQEEAVPEPAPTEQPRGTRHLVPLVSLMLLCMLAAGTVSYLYLLPLTASATVILTPQVRRLQTTATLTIAANPQAGQVQGRELEPVSFTRSKTVPATGEGHVQATQATGVITFSNADATQSYTISAGTSFTIQSVTVVTDQTVTVQAAILTYSFGTAITPAHVIQAGSAGNLSARAISTRCCGSQFLTAINTTPFSGGQDERYYSYAQTSDIQNAANDLLAALSPQATAALAKEARTGEQLVTPLCTPHTTSSLPAGSEGASVTVSVTEQCRSVAYRTASLNQVATAMLAQSANLANYQQAGTVQVTVNGSTYADYTARLNVSLAGLWVYHFTQEQLTQLAHQIAGESQEQARATLERGDGVASGSVHLQRFDFKDQLPTDPQHITIQVFYIVS